MQFLHIDSITNLKELLRKLHYMKYTDWVSVWCCKGTAFAGNEKDAPAAVHMFTNVLKVALKFCARQFQWDQCLIKHDIFTFIQATLVRIIQTCTACSLKREEKQWTLSHKDGYSPLERMWTINIIFFFFSLLLSDKCFKNDWQFCFYCVTVLLC